MSRYTTGPVISLPRLDATGAVALCAQTISAAEGAKREKRFPREAQKPLDILSEKYAALAAALSAVVVADEPEPGIDIVPLDRAIDAAWSGTDDRLLGMSRLVGEPKAAEAAALRARLFPTGLKFLNYPYKNEWAESKARLDRIDAEGLGPALDRLAGKEFLPALRRAHTAYGDALGLSAPAVAPAADEARLRVPFDPLLKALRRYVATIIGLVDEDDEASAAMARALLWPLDAWNSATARKDANGAAGAVPQGPPSEAPGNAGLDAG